MFRPSKIVCVIFLLLVTVFTLAMTVPRVQGGTPSILSYIVTLHSCDKDGNWQTVFGPAEYVYACGKGYDPGEKVTLRVIPNGLGFSASHSKCDVLAEADSEGRLVNVKLCILPPGTYDLWADRENDGLLKFGYEPIAGIGCPGGFLVVPEYLLGTIAGLAGCFGAFGVFRLSKRKTT